MTEKEKAKAYDKAIERAKIFMVTELQKKSFPNSKRVMMRR